MPETDGGRIQQFLVSRDGNGYKGQMRLDRWLVLFVAARCVIYFFLIEVFVEEIGPRHLFSETPRSRFYFGWKEKKANEGVEVSQK